VTALPRCIGTGICYPITLAQPWPLAAGGYGWDDDPLPYRFLLLHPRLCASCHSTLLPRQLPLSLAPSPSAPGCSEPSAGVASRTARPSSPKVRPGVSPDDGRQHDYGSGGELARGPPPGTIKSLPYLERQFEPTDVDGLLLGRDQPATHSHTCGQVFCKDQVPMPYFCAPSTVLNSTTIKPRKICLALSRGILV
jgi:hypothetical protein